MANAPGAQRIEMPPSSVSGELYGYLTRLALAVNNLPSFSYTSYASPESNVTGAPGAILVNIAANSAATRTWVKQSGTGNTGWQAIGTSSAGSGAVNSVSGTTHRIDAVPTTGAVVVNVSPDYDSKISAPVTSVSARTGAVTLTAADISAGTFTGAAYGFGGVAVAGRQVDVYGSTSLRNGGFILNDFSWGWETAPGGGATAQIGGSSASNYLQFYANGLRATIDTGTLSLVTGLVLKVGATQVISARTAAVSNVSGGVVQDAESRTAINALLADLRWHGLIS